jgi:hypothetical protein
MESSLPEGIADKQPPSSPLDAALDYLKANLSIIPIKSDGSKRPALSAWGLFQKRLATEKLVRGWWEDGSKGIGILCGTVSGNLECIDFDRADLFEPWRDLVETQAPGLVTRLCIVRTPREPAGYHVRYRCRETPIPGSMKLAQESAIDSTTGKPNLRTLIETRGEGGYALAPGSPPTCHETGRTYNHIAGPRLTDLAEITAQERELLIAAARSFDLATAARTKCSDEANSTVADLRPGDDFNQRGQDWLAILEPHGWERAFSRGETTYWRRPDKDSPGISATTGYCKGQDGADLLAVFSTNAFPFEGANGTSPCSCYGRFAAYTLLNHKGDFSAAARELASQGYGDRMIRHDCHAGEDRSQDTVSPNGSDMRAFTNFRGGTIESADGCKTIKVGRSMQDIFTELVGLTKGWPRRIDHKMLFANSAEGTPLWLESADAAFAWINGQLKNPVDWVSGPDKITKAEFFRYLQQTTENYATVESFPHWPSLPHTYYMHPKPSGGDGKALADLLQRFHPAGLVDTELVRAFFLSLFWGGEAGQRPAWLFTSEDGDPYGGRGVGKSKVVQMAARLVGGHIDGSPNEPIQALVTRLLSAEGMRRRLVLLDNIKTLRFSWAELEGLITTDVISGHRLYAGEGRRPNTLTYCLTLNGATLSRDMAQRCVIVKMARPAHDGNWEADTIALIDSKRWDIVGDVLAALKAQAPALPQNSRWGAWENDVLARVGNPAECLRVIAERQSEVDEDTAEADVVRQAFIEELRLRGHDPEQETVWIPSAILAGIVNAATNEKKPTNKATAYLRTLTIPELKESRRGTGRGWTWWGHGGTPNVDAVPINAREECYRAA